MMNFKKLSYCWCWAVSQGQMVTQPVIMVLGLLVQGLSDIFETFLSWEHEIQNSAWSLLSRVLLKDKFTVSSSNQPHREEDLKEMATPIPLAPLER